MTDNVINRTIRESAMITSIHTKSWTARSRDDKASRAAAEAAGADKRAYATHKNLMFGADGRLKKVRAAQSYIRHLHMEATLPWGSGNEARGGRLLPVVSFNDYMRKVGEAKRDFESALTEFLDHYEEDAAAARENLNISGVEQLQYPSVERLKSLFSVRVEVQPIPDGAQFHALPTGAAESLERSYEDRVKGKLENALGAAHSRAVDTLRTFSERVLGDKMRQSSWQGVSLLPDMLDSFNIVADEDTEKAAAAIRRELVDKYKLNDCRSNKHKHEISRVAAELADNIATLLPEDDGSDEE